MSDNGILARFCKCGDLHHLSRRFHNLTGRDAKQAALDLIREGMDPAKAISKARRVK